MSGDGCGALAIEGEHRPGHARGRAAAGCEKHHRPSTGPPGTAPSSPPLLAEQELIDAYGRRFPHIEQVYGPDCVEIFHLIDEDEAAAIYVRADPPLLRAEVIHSVRAEMAIKLSDVVLRRTDSGTTGCPTRQELREMAGVMAVKLGWDEMAVQREVEEVLIYYRDTRAATIGCNSWPVTAGRLFCPAVPDLLKSPARIKADTHPPGYPA
jgi:hypothetical protein